MRHRRVVNDPSREIGGKGSCVERERADVSVWDVREIDVSPVAKGCERSLAIDNQLHLLVGERERDKDNRLYCTVLYCIVLHCTVLYCIVLYCTVLYYTVLYCI